jgi:hypothetical protein
LKSLKQLIVKLPGNAVAEYALPVSQIDHIILFEELMLRRVDELLKEGDIRKAYELLLRVEKEFRHGNPRSHGWKTCCSLNLDCVPKKAISMQHWRLLDELANRNIKNPELRPRFGEIVAPMIQTAMADEDFHKARYLISRIEKVFPGHETAVEWQGRMQKMANSTAGGCERAEDQRESIFCRS